MGDKRLYIAPHVGPPTQEASPSDQLIAHAYLVTRRLCSLVAVVARLTCALAAYKAVHPDNVMPLYKAVHPTAAWLFLDSLKILTSATYCCNRGTRTVSLSWTGKL